MRLSHLVLVVLLSWTWLALTAVSTVSAWGGENRGRLRLSCFGKVCSIGDRFWTWMSKPVWLYRRDRDA